MADRSKQKSAKQAKKLQRKRQRQQKLTLYTTLVVVLVALGALAIYGYLDRFGGGGEDAPPAALDLERQPALGDPLAPVKVVEFGDYKCPACAQWHEQVFSQLEQAYVRTNQVSFHFMNFAFIAADSTTAGIAGECVYRQNPTAFWPFHDALYHNQGPESQAWATPSRLLELARDAVPDVDEGTLRACIEQQQTRADVEEDRRVGEALGVTGTPTLFVNGRRLANSSYSSLKAAIDRALLEQ